MAKLVMDMSLNLDMDKFFPKGLHDENLDKDMVNAGLEVMRDAIHAGAQKHIVTGHMAKSVKIQKAKVNKNGLVSGHVRFAGSEGVFYNKKGERFDRTNWIKAFRIEYGTSKQRKQPFVRPAIQNSQGRIWAAMEKVFQQKAKG